MRVRLSHGALALTLLALAGAPIAAYAQADQPAQNPGSAKGDTQPAGSEPPHGNAGATGDTQSPGPIGSGPQTMPAKFDENVAARDRLPIMARPLPLTDEQKKQVFHSVMNNAQVAAEHTGGTPATILPANVELNPLPSGMEEQIPVLRGFKYVKLQDRVLLVSPANRVVVGEITR